MYVLVDSNEGQPLKYIIHTVYVQLATFSPFCVIYTSPNFSISLSSPAAVMLQIVFKKSVQSI